MADFGTTEPANADTPCPICRLVGTHKMSCPKRAGYRNRLRLSVKRTPRHRAGS